MKEYLYFYCAHCSDYPIGHENRGREMQLCGVYDTSKKITTNDDIGELMRWVKRRCSPSNCVIITSLNYLGEAKYGDHTLLLKAFEEGFNAGVFWESSEEAFAKTTREPYKTPKQHVNELFDEFLKKLEG